jgi:hypothetical protein
MSAHFKISRRLYDETHADLARRHAFAHERVGFIYGGVARIGGGPLTILAQAYEPVADDDYLDEPGVGAMMGPDAIRKALERAYRDRTAVFHVHCHTHCGTPDFSGIDRRENDKFVPNFFNVAAARPHGAIVFSLDRLTGAVWLGRDADSVAIDRLTIVGAPMTFVGGQ